MENAKFPYFLEILEILLFFDYKISLAVSEMIEFKRRRNLNFSQNRQFLHEHRKNYDTFVLRKPNYIAGKIVKFNSKFLF